jgi:hypothetical protein
MASKPSRRGAIAATAAPAALTAGPLTAQALAGRTVEFVIPFSETGGSAQ